MTGYRGRRGDPTYDLRKILITASGRWSKKTFSRVQTALNSSDLRDEVDVS